MPISDILDNTLGDGLEQTKNEGWFKRTKLHKQDFFLEQWHHYGYV